MCCLHENGGFLQLSLGCNFFQKVALVLLGENTLRWKQFFTITHFYTNYIQELIGPYWSLRATLGPLLETFLLLDRLLFLQEQGRSVKALMLPIFDPEISPRNVAIIAQRIWDKHETLGMQGSKGNHLSLTLCFCLSVSISCVCLCAVWLVLLLYDLSLISCGREPWRYGINSSLWDLIEVSFHLINALVFSNVHPTCSEYIKLDAILNCPELVQNRSSRRFL